SSADLRARAEEAATDREAVHNAALDGIEHFLPGPTVEAVLRIAHLLGLSNELEEAGFLLQIDKRERLVVVILPDIAAFDELDPRLLGSDPAGIHVLQIVERPWGAIVATVVHAAVIDAANDHFMFAS